MEQGGLTTFDTAGKLEPRARVSFILNLIIIYKGTYKKKNFVKIIPFFLSLFFPRKLCVCYNFLIIIKGTETNKNFFDFFVKRFFTIFFSTKIKCFFTNTSQGVITIQCRNFFLLVFFLWSLILGRDCGRIMKICHLTQLP